MKKIAILLAGFALFSVNLVAEEVYATFVSYGVKEASLKLNASGIVDTINVDVGSKVKKGDVLLKIKNNTQIESVKMQQAQADANEQTYLFQKSQYERYEQSKSVIDKNTFEQIYSTFKSAENQYKTSLASLQLQKETLNNTYLKAPFSGTIATKSIELGEGVTQNSTELFTLISDEIKLVLEFDSKYIGKVKVGDVYNFSVDNAKNKQSATISKVYPSIDSQTRKVKAEAKAQNMVSGVFGDGFITTK